MRTDHVAHAVEPRNRILRQETLRSKLSGSHEEMTSPSTPRKLVCNLYGARAAVIECQQPTWRRCVMPGEIVRDARCVEVLADPVEVKAEGVPAQLVGFRPSARESARGRILFDDVVVHESPSAQVPHDCPLRSAGV